jgi:predicted ATP-dependent serine protease
MTNAQMDLGIAETDFNIISNVEVIDDSDRLMIGVPTLDNMFGGKGLMPGSIWTVCAPAGCGKTTLLLQTLDAIVHNNPDIEVGYVSGEESVEQIAYNARRINVKNVQVANISDTDKICDSVMNRFKVIAVDSFQCLTSKLVKGKAKTQLYSIARLVKAAKQSKCIVFNICHLTKDGKIKGDSTVIHAVDATLQIAKGDSEVYGHDEARIISVDKNRFGKTGETVLRMGSNGYDLTNTLK